MIIVLSLLGPGRGEPPLGGDLDLDGLGDRDRNRAPPGPGLALGRNNGDPLGERRGDRLDENVGEGFIGEAGCREGPGDGVFGWRVSAGGGACRY